MIQCSGLMQIQELVEAIVLPMTHKDRFQKLGIRPPKGVLLYGPPGTGKTLMARACAAQTNATFLKLAGPQLVQVTKILLCKRCRNQRLAKSTSGYPCIHGFSNQIILILHMNSPLKSFNLQFYMMQGLWS